MSRQVVGVLGLGIFGSSICKTLSEFDVDIIAIDLDQKNVERIKDYVVEGVVADFTDYETLRAIGFEDVNVAIIASGSNLEASILATIALKKLGVTNIYAKAKNKTYMEIFSQLGIKRVVRPEKEMGEKLARELMRNNIIDSIYLDNTYSVVEFHTPKSWIGKSVLELNIRAKYKINIIGVRNNVNMPMIVDFNPNHVFEEENIIVAIAESKKFEELDRLNKI